MPLGFVPSAPVLENRLLGEGTGNKNVFLKN
jgi:hypothetical protein